MKIEIDWNPLCDGCDNATLYWCRVCFACRHCPRPSTGGPGTADLLSPVSAETFNLEHERWLREISKKEDELSELKKTFEEWKDVQAKRLSRHGVYV